MGKKIKAMRLVPYKNLDKKFTKVANSMIYHIKDPYAYKVYCYLCIMHNSNYNYAFPSLSTISNDCQMSLQKVQKCIKWLNEKGFIVKVKLKRSECSNVNNIYYMRYIEIDYDEIEKELEIDKPLRIDADVEVNI